MTHRPVRIAVAFVAAAVAGLSLSAQAQTASAPASSLTMIRPKPLGSTSITATGRIQALTTARISPRVSGHLVELGKNAEGQTLEAGMTVRKGDLLFALSQTNFKNAQAAGEAALASARASLDNIKAPTRPERIEQLKQAIVEVKARLDETKRDVDRYTRLVEEKTAPAKRLEEARTAATAAEAQVRAAESRLEESLAGATKTEIAMLEARVKEAETALKITTDELADTIVRAPFDGMILRRMKSVGDYIAANPPVEVFELLANDSLEAELRIPESYMPRVTAGKTRVKLSSMLLKAGIEATVTRVVGEIDPARGTFPCRIAIPAGSKLVPGAFVNAEIMLDATEAQVLVPARAILSDAGKPYVLVAEDGKLARRNVVLGDRLTESVVVRDGLTPADSVALSPPEFLKEGTPVPAAATAPSTAPSTGPAPAR